MKHTRRQSPPPQALLSVTAGLDLSADSEAISRCDFTNNFPALLTLITARRQFSEEQNLSCCRLIFGLYQLNPSVSGKDTLALFSSLTPLVEHTKCHVFYKIVID